MKHVEQHILELYVLNTAAVEPRKAEIEAHLAECAGCRALVEQMTESYGNVESTFNELEAGPETTGQNLVPHRFLSIAPKTPVTMASASYWPVTALQRFQYFVRRHPVMVGGGSFAALAGLALLANLTMKPASIKDNNPATYRYNPVTNAAEILNKKNEIVWQILSKDLASVQQAEHNFLTPHIVINDIDGDGANEVITTLWQPGERLGSGTTRLRVYREGNNLWFEKKFTEQVRYLNRSYSDVWSTDIVITAEAEVRGKKDIFVRWGNGRSPSVIVRYDAGGNELGQYWHFGNISGIFAIDINGDGKKELILTGINDTEDTLRQEFPAIVVLDPHRIVGEKKSVCSPGFALSESDAELYYLRLPVSPLSLTLSRHETVTRLVQSSTGTLAFDVVNSHDKDDEDKTTYEYRFSPDFRILEVRSTTWTDHVYARKVNEGLLKGTIDAAYLDALKNGVRYWDGEKWVKVAVKITNREVVQK